MGKKESAIGLIAGGIVVGVVVLLVGNPIADFFSKPNLIGNTQSGTTKVCPVDLDFSRGVGIFSFSYANLGDDTGSFLATISSNDVLSRYQTTSDDFKDISSKTWFADVGKSIGFNFEIKRIDDENPPKTITINVDVSCQTSVADTLNIGCGNNKLSCQYKLDESRVTPTYYQLMN